MWSNQQKRSGSVGRVRFGWILWMSVAFHFPNQTFCPSLLGMCQSSNKSSPVLMILLFHWSSWHAKNDDTICFSFAAWADFMLPITAKRLQRRIRINRKWLLSPPTTLSSGCSPINHPGRRAGNLYDCSTQTKWIDWIRRHGDSAPSNTVITSQPLWRLLLERPGI